MPSSIDRSAPAQNASLADVTTTPLIAASSVVCFTIASSSSTEVGSSTFIERPGISQVTSAMPSASVSTLKFLKAMCCSQIRKAVRARQGGGLLPPPLRGRVGEGGPPRSVGALGTPPPTPPRKGEGRRKSHALD